MILSCAAHKWEPVVLQYPLRSYCNFEVGHLHGNGTLEIEVHYSGTDVRIQGGVLHHLKHLVGTTSDNALH